MKDKKSSVDWGEIQKKITEAKSKLSAKEKSSREEVMNVLRERAEKFATQDKAKLEVTETICVLEFLLGQESYAIKTESLKEILASDSITEVPCTPSYIYGIINVRGRIVSVLDLKKYLNLDYVGINDYPSVVIAIHNDDLIGIIADEIKGIKYIDKKDIQESNIKLKTIKKAYISGITNETTVILNIDELLSDKAIHVNEIIT